MRWLTRLLAWSLLLAVLPGCTGAARVPPTATPPAAASAAPTVSLGSASPPCPVTAPNGSTPPGERPSPAHHGNGELYSVLWHDGTARMLPHEVQRDGSLQRKFPWWRGVGVRGRLTVEGRRLDAPAPPLRADIPGGYGETGLQATALIFPTEGCWEVTGKAGNGSLTFVILVVKDVGP